MVITFIDVWFFRVKDLESIVGKNGCGRAVTATNRNIDPSHRGKGSFCGLLLENVEFLLSLNSLAVVAQSCQYLRQAY
jgi:hypothetical protein